MKTLEEGSNILKIDSKFRRNLIGKLRAKANERFKQVDQKRLDARRKILAYRRAVGLAYLNGTYTTS